MRAGPLRWVVLFFTRPIHLSDIAAVLRTLKPRPKSSLVPAVAAAPEPERPLRPRAKGDGATRPRVTPVRDPSLDTTVSEQPLDTLPAELQNEFGVTTSPAPDTAQSQ